MGSRGPFPVLGFLLLASALQLAANPTAAEETAPTSEKRSHALCWRGRPYPECRSFLITEVGVSSSSAESSIEESGRPELVADLGWMKNISARAAVGGTIHAKLSPADYIRAGVRARYRLWLSRSFSVDLSPGVIVANKDDFLDNYLLPGWVAGATLNLGDLVALSVDAERARYSQERLVPPGVFESSRFSATTWRVVWKLGSYPGTAGILLFIAGSVVQFSVLGEGS